MPVCAGEYLYGIAPHRQTLAHHSVDIVMIDVLRAGGITPWMKIAGMAEAFNRPVVSHLLPELHVHLIAAAPNGLVVEYMPWTFHLFDDPPVPVKGEMTVPTAPGLGLKFTRNCSRNTPPTTLPARRFWTATAPPCIAVARSRRALWSV